jgi:hypothetical protein
MFFQGGGAVRVDQFESRAKQRHGPLSDMVLGDTVGTGTGVQPTIPAFYDAYYKTLNGAR